MAIRDKITVSLQPQLEPGETVQAVFPAQTMSPYWAVLTYLVLFFNKYRVVAATDRRILVCDTARFSTAKVKGVRAAHPRGTRIGPPSGLWWKCESLGEKMYVHKRFHKDVEQADAVLGHT